MLVICARGLKCKSRRTDGGFWVEMSYDIPLSQGPSFTTYPYYSLLCKLTSVADNYRCDYRDACPLFVPSSRQASSYKRALYAFYRTMPLHVCFTVRRYCSSSPPLLFIIHVSPRPVVQPMEPLVQTARIFARSVTPCMIYHICCTRLHYTRCVCASRSRYFPCVVRLCWYACVVALDIG